MVKSDPIEIKNVNELFCLRGEDFVNAAYRVFLGREADIHGLRYYLGRLALGYDMVDVVDQLSRSPDCKVNTEIEGLRALLRVHRRQKHWLLRWFVPAKANVLSGVFGERIDVNGLLAEALAGMNKSNVFFEKLADKIVDSLGALQKKTEELVVVARQPSSMVEVAQVSHAPSYVLSDDDVVDGFLTVLGRTPENNEVIEYHRKKYSSIPELYSALMEAEEFFLREKSLSPSARLMFRRTIVNMKVSRN